MPRHDPTSHVNTRWTQQQLSDLDVAIFEWNATHPKDQLKRGSFIRRGIDRFISEMLRKRRFNSTRKGQRQAVAGDGLADSAVAEVVPDHVMVAEEIQYDLSAERLEHWPCVSEMRGRHTHRKEASRGNS